MHPNPLPFPSVRPKKGRKGEKREKVKDVMDRVLYDIGEPSPSIPLYRLRLRRCLRLAPFLLGFPRSIVTQATPTDALARPSKLLGQVLGGDLREELVPVRAPDDVDLANGDLVEPDLDDGPHGAERPRRVDDVELAHDLRVAVLPDRRRRHDVLPDAVKVGERDALQVQDRAECLHRVPDRARGGGHARRQRTLVLADQPVQQPFLRRDRVERSNV